MKTLTLRASLLLGLTSAALVPLACGGSHPPPATTPTTPGPTASATPTPEAPSASAATAAAPVAWKDMNHGQRLDFMMKSVLPKMKEEFGAFDAKRFGGMNCKTCHGDGAKDGSFKMPNPGLPKLPATPEGFQKRAEKQPEIFKFMMSKVEPDMATLVGEKPFDMKTHEGFGCFECHTKEP